MCQLGCPADLIFWSKIYLNYWKIQFCFLVFVCWWILFTIFIPIYSKTKFKCYQEMSSKDVHCSEMDFWVVIYFSIRPFETCSQSVFKDQSAQLIEWLATWFKSSKYESYIRLKCPLTKGNSNMSNILNSVITYSL